MEDSPRNYGVHRYGEEAPTIELQQKAFAALKDHPLYLVARSYSYCTPAVMLEPVSFIDRVRCDEQTKQNIQQRLSDTDMVLLVSWMTSSTKPEPLSGGGASYDFALHPKTLEVLHFSTGTWRS